MSIDFSCPEGAAPQKENTPTQTNTATVTIRVDADSLLLCDGEYIEQPFNAGVVTKVQLPLGQHLLEFLYMEDPDIKIKKEVDFPESGKSYLVLIKGLKDLVDGAAAEEAKRKAKEEAKRKADEVAKKKAEIKRAADLAEDYYYGRNGKSKDYEKAAASYHIAAVAGDANSQCSLGWCYEKGQGVAKSAQEAEKWYRKAAEQGEKKAEKHLARILGEGYYFGCNGKSKDYEKAAANFHIAAKAGDAYSQYVLGFCCEKGQGVEQSEKGAVKWYRKAAEQGEKNAIERLKNFKSLGNDYYNGSNGKSKDYEKAVEYYRIAAEAGDAYSQYSLGFCYEKGQGVETSVHDAVKWYRKAAEQGEKNAKERLENAKQLGVDYYFGENGKYTDYIKAVAYFRLAAEDGDAYAQYCLGVCYEHGQGVKASAYDAVKWYRKAAEQGEKHAKKKNAKQLGCDYYFGENGKSVDYRKAVAYLLIAAENGDVFSQYLLGGCYESGYGVSISLYDAEKWYRRAAKQGYSEAKECLKKLESRKRS